MVTTFAMTISRSRWHAKGTKPAAAAGGNGFWTIAPKVPGLALAVAGRAMRRRSVFEGARIAGWFSVRSGQAHASPARHKIQTFEAVCAIPSVARQALPANHDHSPPNDLHNMLFTHNRTSAHLTAEPRGVRVNVSDNISWPGRFRRKRAQRDGERHANPSCPGTDMARRSKPSRQPGTACCGCVIIALR
jgi:hypothetical protein